MASSAANPSHALAVVLVDELVRAGVTDAVVAPGSRSTALAMALHADDRMRLHVQIDERSAGFLAVGLARATGDPAVVVTTSGGATVNLHPAVVEADTAGVPLLLVTADRPPELRDTGANQTIDQLKLYGDAVRWFCELGVPEDVPGIVATWRSTACRAVAEARGLAGPAGPVHCNVAFREPTVPATDDGRAAAPRPFDQPLDGRPDGAPWTRVAPAPRVPDEVEVTAMADRLSTVERGLLVVGHPAVDGAAVDRLATTLGWPIVAEPGSGARHGPHVVAHAGPLLGAPGFAGAHAPDLVLRLGRPTVSRAVLSALDAPEHVAVVADGRWHDPTRSTTRLLVAEPSTLCDQLVDRCPPRHPGAWWAAWREADAAAEEAVVAVLADETGHTEPGIARDTLAAVPSGGTLCVASSMPVRDLDAWAPARGDVRVVANRGASGIDGFVSTSLGIALGHPGPTVALAGDLSFLHDINGLLARPDGAADLVLVVVDNDGGGIFHFLPQAGFPDAFERVFGTPHGTDLPGLARAHGLAVATPDPGALAAEVTERAAAGGRHLVHVRTDRQDNLDLHRRLQSAVTEAVGG